jgi:hypothetical protein
MATSKAFLAVVAILEAAATAKLTASDTAKHLSDAVNDLHRGTGNYGGYLDHIGDDSSGDVVYSCNGDVRKAPYTMSTVNGKRSTQIDDANSKNVVPHTSYEDELDDSDHYAAQEAAGLYLPGQAKFAERFIGTDERKAAKDSDFAGKGKSFPILKKEDVKAAASSIGGAGPGNYTSANLKKNISAIAKKKGWADELPDAWKGDDASAEGATSPIPKGSVRLVESASFEPGYKFTEAASSAIQPLVKIISPGRGSSGYYTPEVLKRDAGVFKQGTLMYVNHATEAEAAARPEGNYDSLAAVTVEPAKWMETGKDGPGLYARAKVFSGRAQEIAEKAPYTGVSINAGGRKNEKALGPDGKPGVIEALTYVDSIDLVTKAGRDGKLLLESAASAASGGDMDEAQVKALIEAATKPLLAQLAVAKAPAVVTAALEAVNLPVNIKRRIFDKFTSPDYVALLPMKEGAIDAKAVDELVLGEARKMLELVGEFGIDVAGIGTRTTEADTTKAIEQHDKAFAESQAELADLFVGPKLEKGTDADARALRKRARKGFTEGRAA